MGRRPRSNKVEDRMARALDKLADYEQWQTELGPILSKAVATGWTAEKIWNDPKIQAVLAARLVQIASMETDPAKALAAIKDLMDRTVGKPTEKQEIKHRLEKLADSDLDALLATKLKEVGADDSDKLN